MLRINQEKCIYCGACEADCPPKIHGEEYGKCVRYRDGKYEIECEHCTRCMACVKICPVGAVEEV